MVWNIIIWPMPLKATLMFVCHVSLWLLEIFESSYIMICVEMLSYCSKLKLRNLETVRANQAWGECLADVFAIIDLFGTRRGWGVSGGGACAWAGFSLHAITTSKGLMHRLFSLPRKQGGRSQWLALILNLIYYWLNMLYVYCACGLVNAGEWYDVLFVIICHEWQQAVEKKYVYWILRLTTWTMRIETFTICVSHGGNITNGSSIKLDKMTIIHI
jgi:hypothetical protein